MKSAKTNTIHLTHDEMVALRAIASSFGLLVPKGPGAGEIGNVRALIARLAAAYRCNQEQTLTQLAPLVLEELENNKLSPSEMPEYVPYADFPGTSKHQGKV